MDACIKDLSRQTEGEIHRVCAEALDIDKSKSKGPPFHLVLVCTSVQTAGSRYLSLSQALKTKRLDSSLLRGSRGGCRRRAQNLPECVPRLSPPKAGCPHPSRCSAKAQRRATFPQGEGYGGSAALPNGKRSALLGSPRR